MSLRLHNHDLLADAYAVRLLAALIGIELDLVTVALLPGEGRNDPAFRAINPAATVPTLVDGDVVLARPTAILAHLALTRDPSGTWFPAAPAARARTLDWLAFAAGPLGAAEEARLASVFGRLSALKAPAASARAAFRVLEGHLGRRRAEGRSFLAADHATIADIAVFPAVALIADIGLSRDEFPELAIWERHIHALPGFITMSGVREFV